MIKLRSAKKLPKSNSGRNLKYPFNNMNVGKFFELRVSCVEEKKSFYSAFVAARRYAQRQKPKWKFASRLLNKVGQIHRIK